VSQVGYATQVEDDCRSKRELSRTEIAYLAGLIKDYNTFSFESLKWQSPTQYCSVKPVLGIIDNDISRVLTYFLS
jgi:hypothetical protein